MPRYYIAVLARGLGLLDRFTRYEGRGLPPTHSQHQATKPRGFLSLQKAKARQAISAAWAQLKAFGRELVRKIFWLVILPLSVACILWIPFAGPAELPLAVQETEERVMPACSIRAGRRHGRSNDFAISFSSSARPKPCCSRP